MANVIFLTGLSPILFALTVDSEELNIVRQVCISWGRLNNHEGDGNENGKKAFAKASVKAELFQLAHFVQRERTLPALTIPENHVYCLVNG